MRKWLPLCQTQMIQKQHLTNIKNSTSQGDRRNKNVTRRADQKDQFTSASPLSAPSNGSDVTFSPSRHLGGVDLFWLYCISVYFMVYLHCQVRIYMSFCSVSQLGFGGLSVMRFRRFFIYEASAMLANRTDRLNT